MQVGKAMTHDVQIATPEQSICDVARIMADCNVGSLPVGEKDRLVGMITDRDIAVRAVAQHLSPETKVRQIMTQDVKYCFEDEEISHVVHHIGDLQVHRMPVLNRDKRLVGILSLADIATHQGPDIAGEAVCGILANVGLAQPGSSVHH